MLKATQEKKNKLKKMGGIDLNRQTKAGSSSMQGFGLKMFSEEELRDIHYATLEVLEKTGVKFVADEALDIFEDAGAIVDRGEKIVKIPPYIVEDAINTAPSKILLAGRDPENDIVAEGKRVYFTTFGEGIKVIDPFTGEYRDSTKEDCANSALMCDALEDIDVCLRPLSANNVPRKIHSLHELDACLNNVTKPILLGGLNKKITEYLLEMASAVAGGMDKLRERPLVSIVVCPTSPLQITEGGCEAIITASRKGVPVNILSMAMGGASSPVTLGGTLVTHNAEVLAGLVLTQLVNKGVPVIYGSSTTIMDLKKTTASVGAPELGMINAAVAALSRYYLLPSWVAGG